MALKMIHLMNHQVKPRKIDVKEGDDDDIEDNGDDDESGDEDHHAEENKDEDGGDTEIDDEDNVDKDGDDNDQDTPPKCTQCFKTHRHVGLWLLPKPCECISVIKASSPGSSAT